MNTMMVAVFLGLASGAAAIPAGTATTQQLAGGVADLRCTIANQDYGAASNLLGGQFDNGTGGFSQSSGDRVVDARESGNSGYVGAYSIIEADHDTVVVPSPRVIAGDSVKKDGLFDVALLLSAGWLGSLGTALAYRQQANEGGASPRTNPKPPEQTPRPSQEPKPKGKETYQSTVDIATDTLKGDLPQDTGDYNPRLPMK